MANKKLNEDWLRVFVVGGDPCLSGWAVDAAVEKCGGSARRYDKSDLIASVKATLTEFVMDQADAIIITNPNAEMTRMCYEVVESGRLTASAMIIFTPGGSLDGRTAFASAANKAKRVYYYDHIEANRADLLKQHLIEWENSCRMKFDSDAKDWLLKNAPTVIASIKGRDTEVFDLLCLESEVDKASVVARCESVPLSLELIGSICQFDHAYDVWSVVIGILGGKHSEVLARLDDSDITGKGEGLLWLLLSQIEFLVCLKSLVRDGVQSELELCNRLSSGQYIGKYFSAKWEPLEGIPVPPAINPWRVRKALENSSGWSIERLSSQYAAVTSAIQDLRAGLSTEIVIPYLALAITGDVAYETPLRPLTV